MVTALVTSIVTQQCMGVGDVIITSEIIHPLQSAQGYSETIHPLQSAQGYSDLFIRCSQHKAIVKLFIHCSQHKATDSQSCK